VIEEGGGEELEVTSVFPTPVSQPLAIASQRKRHPSLVTEFLASTKSFNEQHSGSAIDNHLSPVSPRLQDDRFKRDKCTRDGSTSDSSATPSGPSSKLHERFKHVIVDESLTRSLDRWRDPDDVRSTLDMRSVRRDRRDGRDFEGVEVELEVDLEVELEVELEEELGECSSERRAMSLGWFRRTSSSDRVSRSFGRERTKARMLQTSSSAALLLPLLLLLLLLLTLESRPATLASSISKKSPTDEMTDVTMDASSLQESQALLTRRQVLVSMGDFVRMVASAEQSFGR
jgi:hypothetical protein